MLPLHFFAQALNLSTLSREYFNNVILIIFKLLLIMYVATPLQTSKYMRFLSGIFHSSYKFLCEPPTISADAVSTFSYVSSGRAYCLDPKMDFDFWQYIRYHSIWILLFLSWLSVLHAHSQLHQLSRSFNADTCYGNQKISTVSNAYPSIPYNLKVLINKFKKKHFKNVCGYRVKRYNNIYSKTTNVSFVIK
jgi:hypothetical protein